MEKIGDHIAFIPLRAGSKSIPGKNFKSLGNKPLFCHAVDTCLASSVFDRIVIATDSVDIKNIITKRYAESTVIMLYERSEENAQDHSTTESVMLEFSQKHDYKNITLVQVTSPLTSEKDFKDGWNKFNDENLDSLLTVVEEKRFYWKEDQSSKVARPINYKPIERPRRQDFDGTMVENGAFYITSKAALEKSKCRLSGRMGLHVMPSETAFEIDEPADFLIIESLLSRRHALPEKEMDSTSIKLVLTDVDGVLTDAGMYYSENGGEQKKFNTRDGKGFELLRENGYKVGIITGENTILVERRSNKLKSDFLFQGAQDKLSIISKLVLDLGLTLKNVAFIGDDINDLELLSAVGLSFCPADAQAENKKIVDFICSKNGGEGCFREIAELILSANGK